MHGKQIGPEVDLLVLDAQLFPEVVAVEFHRIFFNINDISASNSSLVLSKCEIKKLGILLFTARSRM